MADEPGPPRGQNGRIRGEGWSRGRIRRGGAMVVLPREEKRLWRRFASTSVGRVALLAKLVAVVACVAATLGAAGTENGGRRR